jgi:hypothetical protein
MPNIVYRTAGPWGAGQGSRLSANQVDFNFYNHDQAISALTASIPAGIAYFYVNGNQLFVVLTDHTVLGPYILPTAAWNFRGAWLPNTSYSVNDVVTFGGSAYLVIFAHTSAATFDPNANDGHGHNLYGLLVQANDVLPTGGGSGTVLTKRSAADFDTLWMPPPQGMPGRKGIDGRRAPIIPGQQGSPGPTGNTGPGVPTGGVAGQVLFKNSGTNFDTNWAYPGQFLSIPGRRGLDGGRGRSGMPGQPPSLPQINTQALSISSGAVSINWNLGENCILSLTSNVTSITIVGWPPASQIGRIVLFVSNTGSFTMTGWPSQVKWVGGSAPTITSGSGKKDVLVLITPDNGTTIYGNVVGQNYS